MKWQGFISCDSPYIQLYWHCSAAKFHQSISCPKPSSCHALVYLYLNQLASICEALHKMWLDFQPTVLHTNLPSKLNSQWKDLSCYQRAGHTLTRQTISKLEDIWHFLPSQFSRIQYEGNQGPIPSCLNYTTKIITPSRTCKMFVLGCSSILSFLLNSIISKMQSSLIDFSWMGKAPAGVCTHRSGSHV